MITGILFIRYLTFQPLSKKLENLGCFIAMMKDNENLKNIIDEVIDVWKKDLLDELMNSNNIVNSLAKRKEK